jgi:hypothetical protein
VILSLDSGSECSVAASAMHNDAVEREQDDRADDCRQPRRDVEELIHRIRTEESPSQEAAEDGSDYADDRR